MNNPLHNHAESVNLYLTAEYECSYIPDAITRTLFVDPDTIISQEIYQHLLSIGFRRSGDRVYRPHCQGCAACISIRLPVHEFEPRRAQRRCWQRNQKGLQVIPKIPGLYAEHYDLYQRYTATRHIDGGMADLDSTTYLDFLTTHWCPTMFVEFRYQERLIGVAVTDVLPNALSAVYTFFDPDLAQHSLGVLAVLWQIQEAKRFGLKYLYLGYWIGNCPKMRYKDQYRPLEAWDGEYWRLYTRGEILPLELL